jgi:hypothetical protein
VFVSSFSVAFRLHRFICHLNVRKSGVASDINSNPMDWSEAEEEAAEAREGF